jgi:hypothetical protein
MKKSQKIFIIALTLLLEFCWWAWPRVSVHGYILEESYRHDQRLAALSAMGIHPSHETKQNFEAEVKLLDDHVAKRQMATLLLVLSANGLIAFSIWRWEPSGNEQIAH